MKMYGLMGKILRVDLTNSKITEEALKEITNYHLPGGGTSHPPSYRKVTQEEGVETCERESSLVKLRHHSLRIVAPVAGTISGVYIENDLAFQIA